MVLRMREDSVLPRGYGRRVGGAVYRWKQGESKAVPDDVGAALKDAVVQRGRHSYPIFGAPNSDVTGRPQTLEARFEAALAELAEYKARVDAMQGGQRPQESV
jgi:hypothetical protein